MAVVIRPPRAVQPNAHSAQGSRELERKTDAHAYYCQVKSLFLVILHTVGRFLLTKFGHI